MVDYLKKTWVPVTQRPIALSLVEIGCSGSGEDNFKSSSDKNV